MLNNEDKDEGDDPLPELLQNYMLSYAACRSHDNY